MSATHGQRIILLVGEGEDHPHALERASGGLGIVNLQVMCPLAGLAEGTLGPPPVSLVF